MTDTQLARKGDEDVGVTASSSTIRAPSRSLEELEAKTEQNIKNSNVSVIFASKPGAHHRTSFQELMGSRAQDQLRLSNSASLSKHDKPLSPTVPSLGRDKRN
jgi:hypothetical protein